MNPKALKNRQAVDEIKRRLGRGELTLAQAKRELEPIIADMNAHARKIARRYGTKPRLINASALLR